MVQAKSDRLYRRITGYTKTEKNTLNIEFIKIKRCIDRSTKNNKKHEIVIHIIIIKKKKIYNKE